MVERQLRIYAVKPGHMARWCREWSATVRPLREANGFKVLGPWVIEEENRFVWILEFEGANGFAAADRAYYDSPERRRIRPDPIRHLAKTEHWMMADPQG